MKTAILISTTNTIEGATIEKYLDIVSTNVIVGTNIFSDISASFTDFFGGNSGTYQSKLQEIHKTAIANLKTKASNLGSNAIIGLSVDFDEVSGKGKSMFMISALGTAVKLSFKEDIKIKPVSSDVVIGRESLENEIAKHRIARKLEAEELPTLDDWNYLMNFPTSEISQSLLILYLSIIKKNPNECLELENLLVTNVPYYFGALDERASIEILYSNITKDPSPISEIIFSNNLFSASHLLSLLKDNQINTVVKCLKASKNFYTENDLELMQDILHFFDNLKDLGRIEIVKNLMGKAKEKFICPNGHSWEVDGDYCQEFSCGKNIKGLTKTEVQQIKNFKIKVDSLRNLLN